MTADGRWRKSDKTFEILNSKPKTENRKQKTENRQQTTENRQQITDNRN